MDLSPSFPFNLLQGSLMSNGLHIFTDVLLVKPPHGKLANRRNDANGTTFLMSKIESQYLLSMTKFMI
jgi:hypothetical protein